MIVARREHPSQISSRTAGRRGQLGVVAGEGGSQGTEKGVLHPASAPFP